MIHIRELYFRVTSRPEILPGALRSALMDAGIAACRQSNLLKQTVYASLLANASSLQIPTPSNHAIVRVDTVFYRDPTNSLADWTMLDEVAPVFLERQRFHVESQDAEAPYVWGLRGNTLGFQAPSDAIYPLRITYTWAPTRDSQPESFDLPPEAEETLIAYARYILLQDVDPRAAQEAKREFESGLADLRGMGESGESGVRSIYDFLPSEG